MRLQLFTVKKFRSIIRAERLPLGDLTVLVGPNNEGKSNILQALVMGMEELSSPQAGRRRPSGARYTNYDWERDYPQPLQEGAPDGKTTLHFDFELTEDEIAEFQKAVGSRLNGALPISLVFDRAGVPEFRVRKPRHAKALSAKRKQIAEFVAERVQVQYVPAIRTGAAVERVVRTMLNQELGSLRNDPAYNDAVAAVRRAQQPTLDKLSMSIGEGLKQLLPDVRAVRIEPADDGSFFDRMGPGGVQVVIDDGTPTDLMLKGDGVQSLAALAMLQHYSRETARAREFILAVEEPEAHLHPRAIHALRDTLTATAANQQVVLTTHSPLFVNRLELASNIIVRKNRAQPAENVRELREVLGVRTADNLEGAEVVLIVEGPTDERVLRALIARRSSRLSEALADGTVAIRPLHGGGNLTYVLSELRDSLSLPHAFLDNDESGRRAGKAAEDEGLLLRDDVTYAMCSGGAETELEDLLEPKLLASKFAEIGVDYEHTYTKQLKRGKWSVRMRTVYNASGKPWDDPAVESAKVLIAAAVEADPDMALKESCESVMDALVNTLELKLEHRGAR